MVSPNLPQSECPGVKFNAESGKWRGHVHNRLERTASGGNKKEHTNLFEREEDAVAAINALRQSLDEYYWTSRTALAAADPLTKGLPRGPDNAADATAGTLYWRPNYKNGHKPFRARCTSAGKSGSKWRPVCWHDKCGAFAQQAIKGGPGEFCGRHGGHCPHGSAWYGCRDCNPNVTQTMNKCSVCAVGLVSKRHESKGGNGLCYRCEDRAKAEAADNGSVPLKKTKSWEDFVLDKLTTLVVDANGRVILHEMRDDRKHVLGSNKRTRRDECDTNHQRRPDLLYLVRDSDAHIVAALSVEVDEHSHDPVQRNYTPACEAGKIDETFQSILQLAQTEGAARGAAARAYVRTPYVLFIKFNPNACDAPGGPIRLDRRIEVLAHMCKDVLNTPASEYHTRSDRASCLVPRVQCLYYHTKQGAAHLAYFDAHGNGAWKWRGNMCPR